MDLQQQIETDKKQLEEGESLVGVYDVGNGAYLYIGENDIEHLWAVTDAELERLYEILQRRFNMKENSS